MICPHYFFLKDLGSTPIPDWISADFGNDWRVTCGHCGLSLAGRRAFEAEPITLRWKKSRAWFGELEVA